MAFCKKSIRILETRPFKILSIDGGGVKGLYSALIIQHLEEEFGRPISDYFDMICGTSTGGIIALALSIKTPASTITEFYRNEGPKIFPFRNPNSFWSKVKQGFFRGKYSDSNLRVALENVFGDMTMGDSQNLLCIPSFSLSRGMPRVFKFPHKEGCFNMDRNLRMVDVALATSAAPTFFPIAQIGNEQYVDGGLWANNPALCGLAEALKYFIGKEQPIITRQQNTDSSTEGNIWFESYQILSISSINVKSRPIRRISENPSFFSWGGELPNTSIDGQSFFTNFFLDAMKSNSLLKGAFHRIESPALSTEQAKCMSLDNATNKSINLMEIYGNAVGNEYRASKRHLIEPFFQHIKSYNT